MTSRQVLAAFRQAQATVSAESGKGGYGSVIPGLSGNEYVTRRQYDDGARRYVFGIGTSLRDTLLGHYIVGSGEMVVCFPANYPGWNTADTYTRMRVTAYDLLVHSTTTLRDRTKPARLL